MSPITSVLSDTEALEGAVGARPATHHLKSIADLDPHCEAILAASPLAALGARAGDGTLHTALVGGAPGSLGVAGPTRLVLPGTGHLDVPDGTPAGLLVLVPGYGETLRVNGRLRTGADPHLEVEEAFLHCAKAVIRSKLWAKGTTPDSTGTGTGTGPDTASDGPAPPGALADPDAQAFLARSPFVLLTSVDGNGEADVSPKGDPAGFVLTIDDRTLALPDRPGNRRTDTLHNLLTDPAIGLLALVPGDDRVLEVRGTARTTDDEALRAAMEVNGKTPKAAVVIDVAHAELRPDAALAASGLWDPSRHIAPGTLPKGTKVWVDHVKRNRDPGMAAKAARKLINETMMSKGIESDYRKNLY